MHARLLANKCPKNNAGIHLILSLSSPFHRPSRGRDFLAVGGGGVPSPHRRLHRRRGSIDYSSVSGFILVVLARLTRSSRCCLHYLDGLVLFVRRRLNIADVGAIGLGGRLMQDLLHAADAIPFGDGVGPRRVPACMPQSTQGVALLQ